MLKSAHARGSENSGNFRNLTNLEYYSYRLATRSGFSLLQSSGKLFLEYILDAFLTVEGNRLEWYRKNQKTIRAENYSSLNDFVENVSNEQTTPTSGIRLVLNSQFQGSVRNFKQRYNDAMAIVAEKGIINKLMLLII